MTPDGEHERRADDMVNICAEALILAALNRMMLDDQDKATVPHAYFWAMGALTGMRAAMLESEHKDPRQ